MESAGKLPNVSFFCPAYREEKNLPVLIEKVDGFLQEIGNDYEIIIVEDGSGDRTLEIARELAKRFSRVRIVQHERNQGYGAALRDGFRAARFDYVMYTDSDNQYDVSEFRKALPLLEQSDVVSGYVTEKAVSSGRSIQSAVYNALVRLLFGLRIRDVNCSMKIYKRSVLDAIDIKSASAFIDAEMLIRASRAGFRIAQFPVTHFARSSGVAQGSKPSVIGATVRDMIAFRLGYL